MPVTSKVNLESLITKEELEQLKDIRVKKLPKQIEQLGEGTYGKVFLFKLKDGSFCAGKNPKISLFNKSAKEENIMKKHLKYALGEIKILYQLSHERIIKFFGFYLDQGQIMIFMEVMEGSVKNEIIKKNCLSEMEAMHFFTQATEGLVYLHSRKPRAVIHRDIKCENLLLTVKNNVKLADFGLAIDLAISSGSISISSTAPTSFAGTYFFVAPEIIGKMGQPEVYGRKSDVWSLACTLVQMISGQPPHGQMAFLEFLKRCSLDSLNPLEYSGDLLLPAASKAVKVLLNSLFITESKLRPSAEEILDLARDATNDIGNMYYFGQEVSQSDEEAVKWYRKAAEQGNARGQNNLGNMYKNGRGIPQSDNEACIWYGKAAGQSNAFGQFNLGTMYLYGRGVSQSYDEALKWYRRAADQGNTDAQVILGSMYQNGQGVSQTDEEAVKWYRKAAEQGNARGQNTLGNMYKNGRGVPQSDTDACIWYRKAAGQDNAFGQFNLASIYLNGRGVSQSYDEALKWYRRAADQEHAEAQVILGFMYQNGQGVFQSDEEAVKWYRKAAEQGNADGQTNLGFMYKYGRGVLQSDKEACEWYRKAAEQGHAGAQNYLGFMYRNGRGVPQSDEEACKWYRKAAEQGNTDGQCKLEIMYRLGQGVNQSNEEAVR